VRGHWFSSLTSQTARSTRDDTISRGDERRRHSCFTRGDFRFVLDCGLEPSSEELYDSVEMGSGAHVSTHWWWGDAEKANHQYNASGQNRLTRHTSYEGFNPRCRRYFGLVLGHWSANALRWNAQPPSQNSWFSGTSLRVKRAVLEFWSVFFSLNNPWKA
jgi:hypothetical protein